MRRSRSILSNVDTPTLLLYLSLVMIGWISIYAAVYNELHHSIFSMSQLLVTTVTLAAALPSGTQTYYFSYRYNSLQQIITSNIVLSMFVSLFTLSFLIKIFGY